MFDVRVLRSRDRQGGFTLVELLFVLAIVGLGLAWAVQQFQTSSARSRIQRSVQNVMSLQQSIRSTWSGGPYSDVSTKVAIEAGVVPENYTTVGTSITHGLGPGGNVEIEPFDSGRAFRVTYESLPKEPCVEIARIEGDFYQTEINGTQFTDQPSVSDANSNCNASGNTVRLYSR